MTTALRSSLLFFALLGCDEQQETPDHTDTEIQDTAWDTEGADPEVAPADAQQADVGDTIVYTITGLDDAQAYRVTLVSDANLTLDSSGAGWFIDEDENGAADAGASTAVATITRVNDDWYDGSKTVPGTDDQPFDPSGVFPEGGMIEVEVSAVGAGTAWLVAYENGGASTFLEIDADGAPIEPHGIGGAIVVASDGMPDITPAFDRDLSVDESATYTITDLDDAQAYRVTLVVAENIVKDGASGLFVDADSSGTADAGDSGAVALITGVNSEAIDAAKTWPAGDDDPASPSGIYPVDGQISIEVVGTGAGTVHPVAYANGGASTFLEVDDTGAPIETYAVGSAVLVAE